ncbi:histone lysine acetyltransferase CREBBP-like [Cydia fagiglandana]|uniref:histone lysine acetyltransferase CREBBP-like n=1 Tax=Cydia fagiglandana TaxID=1458189 RepID=UPI002FEE2A96
MDIPDNADLDPATFQEARRLKVQSCISRIAHASTCRIEDCQAPSCVKMKSVIAHTKLCKRKTHGDCPICKQLIALCCYHAKNCRDRRETCSVPFCSRIKQKLKQRLLLMQPITPAFRSHSNDLLLNTISNTNSTMLIFDQLIENKPSFAKKLEREIYDGADSSTDYYRLMATKKWEIEMGIEDKLRMEQREMEEIINLLGNR